MRSTLSRRLRALVPVVGCLLALAACEDDPTGPAARVHPAGGRLWAAVQAPRDLPDDRTWLPFLAARKGERSPGLERVQALRDEGRRLRGAGDLEGALRAERLAAQTAAGALAVVPDPATVAGALQAVDTWIRDAEGVLGSAELPELAEAVASARLARGGAAGALARGDTLEAVGHLTRAATLAREHAPAAVALRVFARAEARLREQEEDLPPASAARVERLLGWTRDAILNGDPERAFRRAVYALQLVERYAR